MIKDSLNKFLIIFLYIYNEKFILLVENIDCITIIKINYVIPIVSFSYY